MSHPFSARATTDLTRFNTGLSQTAADGSNVQRAEALHMGFEILTVVQLRGKIKRSS
jgi:hypothetical protein